ncbi:(2E,6E)-farnesyl diphosphate synthase [Porticoccaceae bacterium LTM1]|nr:(2E,6E)-farnesyl diphosphate synthase [Porticoccaceae bacterium LTM1]
MSNTLKEFQDASLSRVNHQLELAVSSSPAEQLLKAMQYSLLNGGKRIRPLLAYAAAQAVGTVSSDTDRVASAVEMIHAYSLIHDDLPAMDNDDLRRGQPTCHIAFDEATAILAGDALQALAFEQLSQLEHCSPETALKMISELAKASGVAGMVAGQAIDLQSVNHALSLEQLEQMHQLKTGAMIAVSVRLGAMSAGAGEQQLAALDQYSRCIGLAFQVQDDILDVESSTETLGKRQGADQSLNKPTYTSILGLDQAKAKAAELHQSAIEALADFDDGAEPLRAIANYIVTRSH